MNRQKTSICEETDDELYIYCLGQSMKRNKKAKVGVGEIDMCACVYNNINIVTHMLRECWVCFGRKECSNAKRGGK